LFTKDIENDCPAIVRPYLGLIGLLKPIARLWDDHNFKFTRKCCSIAAMVPYEQLLAKA
jgi:hypothetical protein